MSAYILGNSFPLTKDEIIDVTTNGYKWYFPAGEPPILNWSVSSSKWGHPTLQSTETQDDFARVFGNIAEFINVSFNFIGYIAGTNGKYGYEVANDLGSNLNITFGYNGTNSAGNYVSDGKFSTLSASAFCYFPNTKYNDIYAGAPGDAWLNFNNSFISHLTFESGTNGFALLLHEILHGLGLKHPFDDGGTGRPTYTSLDMKYADRQWISVMSYDLFENGGDGAYSGSMPIGPMIFDAIALQYLYGESKFNSGDTTYDLTRYLGNYYNCQWDAGGIDTLDGGNLGFGIYAELGTGTASNGTNTHNIGYITTSLDYLLLSASNPTKWTWLWGEYENINGTPYMDVISGNDLDNTINGGGGDDYLVGGAGNDTFDWNISLRAGNDTMIGGTGNDTYVLDSIYDVIVENASEGIDTVFVGFSYSLLNTSLENVKAFSNQTVGLTLTGNSYGNVIVGGKGGDTLRGNEGDDRITGMGGGDAIYGGTGIDTAVFAYDKGDYLVSKNPTTGSYQVISKSGAIDYVNFDAEKIEFRDTTVDATSYKYYGTTDPVLAGSVSSVYRFFNTVDNAFFYTNSVAERDTVLANSDVSHNNVGEWPYVYQGSSFEAAHTYAKAVPLERFYNTVTHHHFFTSSATEAATVKANSASGAWPFVYEGVSLYVYASDPTPNSVGQEIAVERFYSATLNRHWFTADPTEITQIRLTGLWVDEGIGFWGEKPGA